MWFSLYPRGQISKKKKKKNGKETDIFRKIWRGEKKAL